MQTRNSATGALVETAVQASSVQLLHYLQQRVAAGQLTEAEAISRYAATAHYYQARPGQVDRVLGLFAGDAQAGFDHQPNAYDWYSY